MLDAVLVSKSIEFFCGLREGRWWIVIGPNGEVCCRGSYHKCKKWLGENTDNVCW